MALDEYVSVSSQRDSERAEIRQEKQELAVDPDAEVTELTALYEAKGLSAATARTVAADLTAHGALNAHQERSDEAGAPLPLSTCLRHSGSARGAAIAFAGYASAAQSGAMGGPAQFVAVRSTRCDLEALDARRRPAG